MSQIATFLLSELWPAADLERKCNQSKWVRWTNKPVATKLHDPRNMKSVMSLLWHSWVCQDESGMKLKAWQEVSLSKHLRRMIDYIVTQVPLATNSIYHRHPQCRICFHAVRIDIVWLKNVGNMNFHRGEENSFQLLPFANVPGGRGVQTACWCPHSHIWTDPSWPPVKYKGIRGWELMRFMLSTLCFRTWTGEKHYQRKPIKT